MNANCPDILKKLTPLSKAVSAAMVDMYADIGKSQQLFFHWGAREFRKLQRETLKSGRRFALITVNQNTRTASLPADFEEELFIGYIDDWGKKVSIPMANNLINTNSITTIECEDTCAVCGQNSTICNDLTVTESVDVVIVNDSPYDKTTIKKLYPDGSYYLETGCEVDETDCDTDTPTAQIIKTPVEMLDGQQFYVRCQTYIKGLKPSAKKPICKMVGNTIEFEPQELGSCVLEYIRYPIAGEIVSSIDPIYYEPVADSSLSTNSEWPEWARELLIYFLTQSFATHISENNLFQMNQASKPKATA